jgi:hypothetical protein
MPGVGARVLAEWPHEVDWWYPGVVVASNGTHIEVQFDDGGRAVLTDEQARPLAVRVGSRAQGRWKGGQGFYPAVVKARIGEALHLVYTDGDEEWTSVAMLRLHRDDVP